VKILAETLGKLPLKIYQDSGGIRKATDHYLYTLLKLRPNPYMTANDFWKCLEVQRNIPDGNAYAWIDFDRMGRILGFYPLDSARMQIYVDDVGLLSSKQAVWYVFTDLQGKQYKLKSDEILHFKGLSNNGIAGMSTVEALKGSIENAKAAGNFLNNSSTFAFALTLKLSAVYTVVSPFICIGLPVFMITSCSNLLFERSASGAKTVSPLISMSSRMSAK
jgi:HK97 family phage portal protein